SKKPSTHRCTSHQRQYSTSEMCVCSPHISAEAKNRPIAAVARNSSPTMCRDSCALSRRIGQIDRPTSATHSSNPTNRYHCQKRPMSAYSQPWWPHQKFCSKPSFCMTASHCPANDPTTITISDTNRKLTPNRWYFGSWPDSIGPMYRPVPSHATAIHSTANCV